MCYEKKKLEKVPDPIQITEEQKARVEDNLYTIHRLDETQYNIEAAKISKEADDNNLRVNVRDAIIKNLGRERYAAFDGLKIKKEGEEEKSEQ